MRTIFRNIKSLLFFPLALIPIGMLFYGIGTILMTPNLIGTTMFSSNYTFVPTILRGIGNMIQSQAGLLAAISVSLGLSKRSIVSVLTTIGAYFIMQVTFDAIMPILLTNESLLEFSNIPIIIYPFYLVGGVIIAVVVSSFHSPNSFRDKTSYFEQIKAVLSGSIVGMIVAIILAVIWIYIVRLLATASTVYYNNPLGISIYGFISSLLKPFGLSTLFETLQNYTFIGAIWRAPDPINTNIYGIENVWLAQLRYNNGNFTVGNFTAVRYIMSLFVTPAIGLAIVNTSFVEHRKNVQSIMLFFIIVSALIGFSLPIEIILLLTTPFLFIVNAIISGIIYLVIYYIGFGVNMNLITGTGGGLIDVIFFGMVPGAEKTGVWVVLVVGIISAVVVYFLYVFMIKQFNLKTFGRNKDELEIFADDVVDNLENIATTTRQQKSLNIINALGGADNIVNIYASLYRLHIILKDIEVIDQLKIKENGAAGIFVVQQTAQLIFGAVTQDYLVDIEQHIAENK